jgi:hypothetical protein
MHRTSGFMLHSVDLSAVTLLILQPHMQSTKSWWKSTTRWWGNTRRNATKRKERIGSRHDVIHEWLRDQPTGVPWTERTGMTWVGVHYRSIQGGDIRPLAEEWTIARSGRCRSDGRVTKITPRPENRNKVGNRELYKTMNVGPRLNSYARLVVGPDVWRRFLQVHRRRATRSETSYMIRQDNALSDRGRSECISERAVGPTLDVRDDFFTSTHRRTGRSEDVSYIMRQDIVGPSQSDVSPRGRSTVRWRRWTILSQVRIGEPVRSEIKQDVADKINARIEPEWECIKRGRSDGTGRMQDDFCKRTELAGMTVTQDK